MLDLPKSQNLASLNEAFLSRSKSNCVVTAGAAVAEGLGAGQILHVVHKAVAPAYERMEKKAAQLGMEKLESEANATKAEYYHAASLRVDHRKIREQQIEAKEVQLSQGAGLELQAWQDFWKRQTQLRRRWKEPSRMSLSS